jgi:hypothetical protein
MRVLRGSARRQEGIPQGNPKLKHWATSPVFRRVERPKAKALGYLEAWRNRTLKLLGNGSKDSSQQRRSSGTGEESNAVGNFLTASAFVLPGDAD